MTRHLWLRQLDSLERVAFDSNSLIYLLERRQPYLDLVEPVLQRMNQGQTLAWISVVVEMELLVGPMRDGDSSKLNELEVFLEQTPNLSLRAVDRAIAHRAAQLRAGTRLAPLDSLIAATALEEQCDAIIGNDLTMASRLTEIPYLYLNEYII